METHTFINQKRTTNIMIIISSLRAFFFLCIIIIQSSQAQIQPRVVGGYNADPARYPYYTLVRIQQTNGATFSCGGALIWEDVVVTAAHCKILGGKVTEVYVNRTNAIAAPETGFEHYRTVSKWTRHPQFNDQFLNYENDVMVVKLESPVTEVAPVPLNSNSSILSSTRSQPLTLVGLGQTTSNVGSLPLKLQVATVYENALEECQSSYQDILIEEQQFCASGPSGADACKGDSGGPLLIEGEEEDLLVGLVSFGEDCGDPAYPGVYARISTYHDWLQQRICTLSENPPSSCSIAEPDEPELPTLIPESLSSTPETLPMAPPGTPKVTLAPTEQPSLVPTTAPTATPTRVPTEAPTAAPTGVPTEAPVTSTSAPTTPTEAPIVPTSAPITPTGAPTEAPIMPTAAPIAPTQAPTEAPIMPTAAPITPTQAPTGVPTIPPTTATFAPIVPTIPESLGCEDCWCSPEEPSEECPSEIEQQAPFELNLIATYNSWVLTSGITLQPTDCSPFSEDNPCTHPFANTGEVCAFVFEDSSNNACGGQQYRPETFASRNDIPENAVLTHYGPCGVCSSAQDLTVRMGTLNSFWTETVPSCRSAGEDKLACFEELGFTNGCANLWASSLEAESTLCAAECGDNFFDGDTSCVLADSCRQCWVDQIEPNLNALAGRTMASSGIIEPDFKRSCSDYNSIVHNPCPRDDTDRGNSTDSVAGDGLMLCFSPETTVNVLNNGTVLMKDLNVGDMVLTSDNKYEPVYTFGHYSPTGKADYLQFFPSGLELSADHLLFVQSKGFITASQVQIGDTLSDGKVTDIRHVTRIGMYAPFTPSGKIVVNKIVSSCYVSLQPHTEVLKIGSTSLPIPHHTIAHAFTLPLRLWFRYIMPKNDFQKEGVSSWAEVAVKTFHWIFQQGMPLQWLVMIPLVSLLLCFAILDQFPVLITVVSLIILCRRYYFVKSSK